MQIICRLHFSRVFHSSQLVRSVSRLMWMWSLGTGEPSMEPNASPEDTSPKLCGESSGSNRNHRTQGKWPIPDKEIEQTKQAVKCFNSMISPPPAGSTKAEAPSLQFSMPLLQFSCGNLGSWQWMVYLSHQLHSTFMVIVFYRLIDFYILSKSGSYTTWFII